MPELLVQGGITIPPILCERCQAEANTPRGGNGKFTLQCRQCHARVFVFTSVTCPMLIIWKAECPSDVDFYDYVRARMGEDAPRYGINQRRTGTIEVRDDTGPAAAPG